MNDMASSILSKYTKGKKEYSSTDLYLIDKCQELCMWLAQVYTAITVYLLVILS